MNKSLLKIYAVSLMQLIILFIIVSPIAALIMVFVYSVFGSTTGDINGTVSLLKNAVIIIPATSLPFIIFFACPYVTFMKYHELKSMTPWFFGITGLALIFPVVMHIIKFIFLGALEIYNAITVSFSVFVTLYVNYGVHTVTTLLVSILIHRLYVWNKASEQHDAHG
jgi:hypothetical protein